VKLQVSRPQRQLATVLATLNKSLVGGPALAASLPLDRELDSATLQHEEDAESTAESPGTVLQGGPARQ